MPMIIVVSLTIAKQPEQNDVSLFASNIIIRRCKLLLTFRCKRFARYFQSKYLAKDGYGSIYTIVLDDIVCVTAIKNEQC